MSKVTISGNASGTGTLLIAAPNTNSDITLNLPTTMGTNNGSSVVTTDAAGNLGLGVAPSAWASTYRMEQIGIGASVGGRTSAITQAYLSANWYTDGTNRYIGTGAASQYQQDSGVHYWFTAPSGTAGAAISFAQVMTLDASGNLVLGAASTRGIYKLDIRNDNSIALGGNATYFGTIGYSAGTGFMSLASESGGGINFLSGSTERARIDSSGNLLVGTTTSPPSAGGCIATKGAGTSTYFTHGSNNLTGTTNFVVYNGSNVGVYLVSGQTSWTANSDERLKTALVPFENAAAKVCTLRAGTGRYLTDEESVSRSFLIAQDVQAVLPEAVDASDPDKLGVQYTEVIPLLVAAIKEIKAELDIAKAEIATLKGTA